MGQVSRLFALRTPALALLFVAAGCGDVGGTDRLHKAANSGGSAESLTISADDLERPDAARSFQNGRLAVQGGATFWVGEVIRVHASRDPFYRLRHRAGQIWLDREDNSNLFYSDSSFIVRSGLADPRYLSLESVNFPGHFVRHRNFELFIDRDDGSQLFRSDSTFEVTAPVDDQAGPSVQPLFSLRATNTNRLIRHQYFRGRIDAEPAAGGDVATYRADATFGKQTIGFASNCGATTLSSVMDLNGNGIVELEDETMLARFISGVPEQLLTHGRRLGTVGSRLSAREIRAHAVRYQQLFDVEGLGSFSGGTTAAIVISRFLRSRITTGASPSSAALGANLSWYSSSRPLDLVVPYLDTVTSLCVPR